VNDQQIEQLLVEQGYVSSNAMKKACLIKQETGDRLLKILLSEGILQEKDFTNFQASHFHIPYISFSSIQLTPEMIELIPKKLAYQYHCIPISLVSNLLTVAMVDPTNLIALDDLKEATQMKVVPIFSGASEIKNALDEYYQVSEHLAEVIESVDEDADIQVVEEGQERDLTDDGEGDVPLIRMVNLILQDAIKQRASDIHFECFEGKFQIRYRIDGLLKEALMPPIKMHPTVVARIKILSNLDITEKRLPQDGRFKIIVNKKQINFRVSVMPTYFGEKVVLRILDPSSLKVGLENLGYTDENLEKMKNAMGIPYGMILVTGPTGSGKSTTLYSILNKLNTPERNIMTIEDPVEYQVEGITQTQVHPEIKLTFASGLRSLLRQNPDIMLVGEIRDSETADIAVKAALTGHLLFSTLHTNSASGAVTRLVDMGVEPFLIGSSLIIVVAQRLCRKICQNCKTVTEITDQTLARINIPKKMIPEGKAFYGKGCNSCNGTGYMGRMCVSEVLEVDDEIQEMILGRKSSFDIHSMAVKKGMKTLFDDIVYKFSLGLTTLDEVIRVTSEENF